MKYILIPLYKLLVFLIFSLIMTPLAALLLVLACIWELNLNPIRWKDWPWYPVTITGHMNFHNDWPVWDRRPYSDEDLVYPSYYHQLLGVGAKYIPHER